MAVSDTSKYKRIMRPTHMQILVSYLFDNTLAFQIMHFNKQTWTQFSFTLITYNMSISYNNQPGHVCNARTFACSCIFPIKLNRLL